MSIRSWSGSLLVAVVLATALPRPSAAQSNPTYVQFDPFTVKGVLYRPDSGRHPDVGVLLIHRVNNYLGHLAGAELARRGYAVLTMNSRFDNNEASVVWELIALDVKTGVEYLRKTVGVRHVILLGHSGGGATLSFYQAVAEQGAAFCSAPGKIGSCGEDFPVLPKADALIFVDPSLGNPVGLLRDLNPAVGADDDPRIVHPDLDPFNPANGYNPNGPSSYSEAFARRYFTAQADRMNRLIAESGARITRGGLEGGARFPDDDVVLIARARGARLWSLDPTWAPTLKEPRRVLKINGRVVTELVSNQQPFVPPDRDWGHTFARASLLTLRSFLSTNAIRATNSMDGIDWCSTNNSTPCAVQQIAVPLLVTAMQGGSPIADSELVYEMAVSKDKELLIVEGASHNIVPCAECEQREGQYRNTVRVFFDYVRRWIDARF